MDPNAGFEEQKLDAVLPWLQQNLGSDWNFSTTDGSGQSISAAGRGCLENPDLEVWNPFSLGVTPLFNPVGQQAWMQLPPNVPAPIPEQNLLGRLPLREFDYLDWNLDFPVEVDVSAEPAAAIATTKPFNCTVQGCNSKGFMRKYELERHMKKHNRAQVFPCPVGGCQFSQPTKAFYRRDKLQSHL
ncbi:Regulatory protein brlA [Neofusicoccum parvum]|uniref:Regulatory protein brlA n=1 Tax=Neofusicoccum parvum TaxID=310453 RepID=A0ACB5S1T2_9PEZI|nr:Regulatory protein brlA [Neofusicoccum parvum]